MSVPFYFFSFSCTCSAFCKVGPYLLKGKGVAGRELYRWHLFLVLSSRHQRGDSYFVMLVDINQRRSAIGCFPVFTCTLERFPCALSFFSVLLPILKLYQFDQFAFIRYLQTDVGI